MREVMMATGIPQASQREIPNTKSTNKEPIHGNESVKPWNTLLDIEGMGSERASSFMRFVAFRSV